MSSLETVTVLFTDLVGSTGLATRVGPGAAEELRQDHFAILREAVEQTGGREVKNVGDGLMVVFPSCSNAVACSVGMQQRLERRNRRADEQLAVRVGISAGETDVEEGDYFGPPVVEASRLCNSAAGGQILCSDLVRMMAREGHDFRTAGALDLKGLPDSFPAHEVDWKPLSAGAGALPLPPRLREVPPVSYVGRRQEREGLALLFDQAKEGSRRVAFVSGEPGMGKTRLATQLAMEAHGDGATILYGRCDEELGAPYGPWAEALRHLATEAPEEILGAHAERQGGDLARLVPEVRARIASYPELRETDPETERYLLFGAVTSLLEQATADTPLVLILDDLHWADKPSLSLLRHLVTHGGEMRVLVLATYRDSDLASGHPLTDLLADLHREAGVSRIPLTGLPAPDVVSIMEAAAGHELDARGERLAQAIVGETEGNPFFIAELLRHMVESGALVQGADARFSLEGNIEDLGLPQSVREVVGRRVERLSEPVRRALGVAAVIGRDFDVDLLAGVLETDEDELLDLLEEAVAASVLNESSGSIGRFTFAHALINHTLYQDLGRTRRARLHRRIAEALEEICAGDPGGRVTELAHHWGLAATSDEPSKAVDYARRAGERALVELAPDEALRWFAQAVELRGTDGQAEPAERCDLLIGLGEAQRQIGDPAHRETLLEASGLAEQLADPDRAARTALANNRGFTSVFGEVDEQRVAALEGAVELDGLTDAVRSARLIARLAAELQFDPDHERRWALADEALALARHADDARTLAHVHFDHIYATAGRYDAPTERAMTDELLELAERLGDPALRVRAGMYEVFSSIIEGDLQRANAELERIRSIAVELGQPVVRWFTTYFESSLRFLQGDLAATEGLADEALQIGSDAGQADALMIYGITIGQIRAAQDRAHELVGMIEQAVADNPGLPAWRAALALTYGRLGRLDEAAAILAALERQGFEDIPYDQVRLSALAMLADTAFTTGARDAAAVLYEMLEPWSDRVVWDGPGSYGQVRMYLGMLAATLGRDELADEHLRAACEFQKRAGMRIWAAYARGRWAEILASRGDVGAAREQAELALEMARQGGYAEIERRSTEVLEGAVPTA